MGVFVGLFQTGPARLWLSCVSGLALDQYLGLHNAFIYFHLSKSYVCKLMSEINDKFILIVFSAFDCSDW